MSILHFMSGDGEEYIVLTESDSRAEHLAKQMPGFLLHRTYAVEFEDDDSGALPLDAELVKR